MVHSDHYAVHTVANVRYIQWPLAVNMVATVRYI